MTLIVTSSSNTIYPFFFNTHLFSKKVGKNKFGKHFLKQFFVFDLRYAIQDDLFLSKSSQTTVKAGWLVR